MSINGDIQNQENNNTQRNSEVEYFIQEKNDINDFKSTHVEVNIL